MNKEMLKQGLWRSCGMLLTIAAGAYNAMFLGGASTAAPSNIAVSVSVYGFWLIATVLLVLRSRRRVQTCVKITIVLFLCLVLGMFFFQSPIGMLFTVPLMGIPMALSHHVDLYLMVALLYLSVIAADWLCVIGKYMMEKDKGC